MNDEDRWNERVEQTDHELLSAMQHGNAAAFEALFLRHRRSVWNILIRLLGHAEDADDLTQEVFVRLYRQPPQMRSGAVNLPAWLYRVATNLGYNALRDRQRLEHRHRRAEAQNQEPQDGDPLDAILRSEQRQEVQQALAALSYREQALLVLRYSGLSYGEIANVLEIAPGSVGTLLARAERRFKQLYLNEQQSGGDRQSTLRMIER